MAGGGGLSADRQWVAGTVDLIRRTSIKQPGVAKALVITGTAISTCALILGSEE